MNEQSAVGVSAKPEILRNCEQISYPFTTGIIKSNKINSLHKLKQQAVEITENVWWAVPTLQHENVWWAVPTLRHD
ncbi:MAG: hypothetical protein KME29_14880 [Calothrix sp. FI2-JRJ7]|nr:hypothetical protein [Calothrix sp. FI2-JRJ7]